MHVPMGCVAGMSGTTLRSHTRMFVVPYTFSLGSTTPLNSRGNIELLPHVSVRNKSIVVAVKHIRRYSRQDDQRAFLQSAADSHDVKPFMEPK